MPSQPNYRNQVLNQTQPRILASRIVRVPTEEILLEEIPASFGYDEQDNVELHFYTARSNQLVVSIVTKLSDNIVKMHVVGYDDGTYKTYLQIDFTKLFVDKNRGIAPGEYKLTINFFSDEIGSYNDRVLSVTKISPSRTEVEVAFNNNLSDPVTYRSNDDLLREFIVPSLTKPDAIGVMKKLLKDGVETESDFEGITANNVFNNIEIGNVQTVNSTVTRLQTLGLEQQVKDAINSYLPTLYETIREKIVKGDERLQKSELMALFREEMQKTIKTLATSVDRRIELY